MAKLDKRLRKLNARKVPAVEYLRHCGCDATGWADKAIIERCYDLLGHKSDVRHVSYASLMARYTWIGQKLKEGVGVADGAVVVVTSAGRAAVPAEQRRKFYRSAEWKRMRVSIIERDGAVCRLCSARGDRGAIINVDHIKSLKYHWHLRLDPENLQVLCEDCNIGKGNRSLTIHRSAA